MKIMGYLLMHSASEHETDFLSKISPLLLTPEQFERSVSKQNRCLSLYIEFPLPKQGLHSDQSDIPPPVSVEKTASNKNYI